MVQKGKPQNDENSHHLGMAVICVMVHGVVIKVEDMTQEQGLRISAAVENVLYILCGITGPLCAAHCGARRSVIRGIHACVQWSNQSPSR